jgi:hypothetical protein
MRLYITFFLLVFGLNARSQEMFQRTFGGINDEWAYSVQQADDGGFIICGFTSSFGASGICTNFIGDTVPCSDIYLIRTNKSGDTLWTKAYGGASDDYGWGVEQTNDGGYILVGSTYSFGVGGGVNDVYLIKTNDVGDTLWTKSYGGVSLDGGYSVKQTSDGGYIITGFTYSYGQGSSDVYLIRANAQGDTLWTKTYGGTSGDFGWCVQETSDEGYIISGYTFNFGAGLTDIYLIKTDDIGDTLWTKTYGGNNYDRGNSVQQTLDGGYIITGFTWSFGAGSKTSYLLKVDSTGQVIWTKAYGGTTLGEYGQSVMQTSDGGYIFSGSTYSFGAGASDIYLVKTNASGDTLWTKVYGGVNDDEAYSVIQTSDGGYIISGYTASFGAGMKDVYLIKTDSQGNSGCNEYVTNTNVTSLAIGENQTTTKISSGSISSSTQTITSGTLTSINTLCFVIGITEDDSRWDPIHVYPNPFRSHTTIEIENTNKETLIITLYNQLGQALRKVTSYEGGTITIERGGLPSGMYFLHLQIGVEFKGVKRLVIE